MSSAVRITAMAACLALAAGAGYWIARQQSIGDPVPGGGREAPAGPAAPAQAAREVLYYRNPMGLPDTSPVPKKDSMGMDYVPVYAGEAPATPGAVVLSRRRCR